MGKSEITKKLIVDTATEVLRKNGRITVKDISDESGVNIASVNYHFNDKESLLRIIINNIFDEVIASSKEIREESEAKDISVEDTVRMILDLLYEFFDKNYGIIRYILSEDFNVADPLFGYTSKKMEEIFKIFEPMMSEVLPSEPLDVIEMKFTIVFSSHILTFVNLKRKFGENDTEGMNRYRELYIKEMLKIITQKN